MQDWKDSAVLPHHPVLHMKASQPQQFFISIITLLSGRNQPLVTGAANGFVSFIGGWGGGEWGGVRRGREGGRKGWTQEEQLSMVTAPLKFLTQNNVKINSSNLFQATTVIPCMHVRTKRQP